MKKVKKFKKVFAIIMFAMLIISNLTQVFASMPITESTNTAEIIVGGIEKGVQVTSYKLVNTNFDYTAGQPANPTYSWVDEIKSWITDNYSEYSDLENFYNNISNDSTEAQSFYDSLTKAIKDGTITLNSTTDISTGEQTSFKNVTMGTYLIIAENGYKVYMPTICNIVPTFNTESKKWEINENYTIIAKSTEVQITKTVTDSEKTKDNYSTTDIISYEIVADVPTFLTNALSKTYKISDTLPKGMAYDKNSIEVYTNDNTKLTDNDVTIDTTDDYTFVCDFKYENIKEFEKVKVVYTATLNKNSSLIMGQSGNVNNAKLIYSNNPYIVNSTKERTPDEENKVFTYGIQVAKVDKNDQTKGLADTEFTLSQGGENLYFIKTEDGTYYKAKQTDEGATTNLVVDNNGLIRFYGLDEGDYIITETKAPDNYSIATSTITVSITDKDLNGVLDDSEDTDGIAKIKFTNTKFFVLPFTGGTGTVLFIGTGLSLIIIGIAVVVYKKRKENKTK